MRLRCIVGVMLPEQGGMTPTLLLGVLWKGSKVREQCVSRLLSLPECC